MAATSKGVTKHEHIVWKPGGVDSTVLVAKQTGVSADALNKMAGNFFRSVIDWDRYGK